MSDVKQGRLREKFERKASAQEGARQIELAEKLIRLGRIWIPPYTRVKNGNLENVDAYWREVGSLADLTPDELQAVHSGERGSTWHPVDAMGGAGRVAAPPRLRLLQQGDPRLAEAYGVNQNRAGTDVESGWMRQHRVAQGLTSREQDQLYGPPSRSGAPDARIRPMQDALVRKLPRQGDPNLAEAYGINLNKADVYIEGEGTGRYVAVTPLVGGRWAVLVNGFQVGGNYDRSGAGDKDFSSVQEARDWWKTTGGVNLNKVDPFDAMVTAQRRLEGKSDISIGPDGDVTQAPDTTPSGHRPLHRIYDDIVKDWTKPNFAAVPYLSALRQLNDIKDSYGADSAASVVSYFLSNASSWHGEKAKAIKAELKAIVKKAY